MPGYAFVYKFKPLPPNLTKRANGLLFGLVTKYGRAMRDDLNEITAGWSDDPRFESKEFKVVAKYKGGDLTAAAVTGDDRFRWLDGGTRVRYAVMHKSFVSKTKPGMMSSGPGGGPREPLFVSTKFSPPWCVTPMPPIEARNWTMQIAERYQKTFEMEVNQTVARILSEMFGR